MEDTRAVKDVLHIPFFNFSTSEDEDFRKSSLVIVGFLKVLSSYTTASALALYIAEARKAL